MQKTYTRKSWSETRPDSTNIKQIWRELMTLKRFLSASEKFKFKKLDVFLHALEECFCLLVRFNSTILIMKIWLLQQQRVIKHPFTVLPCDTIPALRTVHYFSVSNVFKRSDSVTPPAPTQTITVEGWASFDKIKRHALFLNPYLYLRDNFWICGLFQ